MCSSFLGGEMRTHLLATTVVAAATLLAATSARAQTSWNNATGSWFNPANWSAGLPPNARGTIVGNGGTANIDAGLLANAGLTLNINGGSTVNLQAPGSSLQATALITVGPNGTLLLSGSTAVSATPTINLTDGTLRATFTGPPLTSSIGFNTGTVAAAAGQTLTLAPGLFSLGTSAIFGSATDTGTVVFAPQIPILNGGSTVTGAGGTLTFGSPSAPFIFGFAASRPSPPARPSTSTTSTPR